MTKKTIPYAKQWVSNDDIHGVKKILASNFLTTGPVIEQFENKLCELTRARHAVACANGTGALHLACMALGLNKNDLGVTSPNSFLASANCIEFCGAQTDFIDIDAKTLCMSPEKLAAYCRKKALPRVVIPVDFSGNAADLPQIHELSLKFGFATIEDAAHAIGSTYTFEGRTFACGSCAHSDMAIFSFHPAKTITTGEGGAVLTNNDDLAFKLRTLRTHGMVRGGDKAKKNEENKGNGCNDPWYYEMETLGYNYRITDFQCALGLSQLERLPQFKVRRNQVVSLYNQAFQGIDQLILPPKKLVDEACPHLYPIQFAKGKDARLAMYNALKCRGINCQVHYIPIYWQPYYASKYGYAKGKCPRAETYYSRTLSLPLYPAITDLEVQEVIEAILENI